MSPKSNFLALSFIAQILVGCNSTEYGDCAIGDGSSFPDGGSCVKQILDSKPKNTRETIVMTNVSYINTGIPLNVVIESCPEPFQVIATKNFVEINIDTLKARDILGTWELKDGKGKWFCKKKGEFAEDRLSVATCTITVKPNTSSAEFNVLDMQNFLTSKNNNAKLKVDIFQSQILDLPWITRAVDGAASSSTPITEGSKTINNIATIGDISAWTWTFSEILTCIGGNEITFFKSRLPSYPYISVSSLRLE